MRSDLCDVQVIFQHQTEKAVCVRETEDGEDVWLPLSTCEIEPSDPRRGQVITLTAPERTLIGKGII